LKQVLELYCPKNSIAPGLFKIEKMCAEAAARELDRRDLKPPCARPALSRGSHASVFMDK
jgi:hypothetical protein